MEHGFTEVMTRLVLELAAILVVAKLGGELFQRWLRLPPVLGELTGGIILGPHALGGMKVLGWGPLFEMPIPVAGGPPPVIPVSPELYAISQIAAVILLFVAGLETDMKLFFRYAGPGFLVAMGGIVVPFALGAYATVLFGVADSFMHPAALFVGAVMTATSVGITARILNERKKLDTPEGVTILAAAVIDDVLGIIVLTVVAGVAATGSVSMGEVGAVGAKAILFWVALTGLGVLLARYISHLFLSFRVVGASVGLALALAFLASGLAEIAGLAMIIGAYSIGLALSGTELKHRLEEPLQGVYHALVPVFFVVMGMLVNVAVMKEALAFGLVVSALAVVSKVLGCGVLALGTGFNGVGAWRIGIGMLPRGEVALIIAGVGLTRGVVGQDIYGVAIMMTMVTTILAPIILVPSFERGGPGRRQKKLVGVQTPGLSQD